MHRAAPREAGARRDTSLEVFKAAFSEGTWPFVGEVAPRREGSSWDTNRCLRTSEDSARVRIFSEEDPSESLTVSEDSPSEASLEPPGPPLLSRLLRTDMPRSSPLRIDLPILFDDPSRVSDHREARLECCDGCPRFPGPPTERDNRSTTSMTAAIMPLSVAHGWKVACSGEVWLDAVRSRFDVSLHAALSRTRRALPMSSPNCFSVGGSTSMISGANVLPTRLLRVDSISAAASGPSSEPSTSSKMRSASVHEKPRPAISSMTMGTPTRWAHHSSSRQYGRRSTSFVARSTRASLHSRPCVKSWCRLERSCESRKHGLCSTFCNRSRRYRASMPASSL